MTAGESRSALDRVAGDGSVELLSSSAMALCSPLCVASGRVPRAITWLVAAGFEVPWVRSLQLQRPHIDGLWERLIPTIPQRRVDVVTASLTAGPSALLGLRRPAVDVRATDHLLEIKGSANPVAREEGSLRSHLGAPNMLTSLIHTPDSSEDLLRELQLLVPRTDELEEFWRAVQTGGTHDNSLPLDLSGDDPPPPITALIIGLRLRARLLDRLADGASVTFARAIGEISSAVDRDLEAAEQSDPFDPLAALARYRATFEPQRDGLQRALAAATTADLDESRRLACGGYAQLDSMAAGEPFDLEVLTATLKGAGVVPNTWECVVLASEWVTPSPTQRRGASSGNGRSPRLTARAVPLLDPLIASEPPTRGPRDVERLELKLETPTEDP